jgi:small ligand-binding sensory domain FIST
VSGRRAAAGAGAGRDALLAVEAALTSVAAGLDGRPADLAVLFLGAGHADAAGDVAARVRERLAPRALLGMTVQGVVAGGQELEDPFALSLWAAALPGAVLTPLRYAIPAGQPASWPQAPDDTAGLLALADPFGFPADAWLSWFQQVHPSSPVTGGIASGGLRPGENRLILDEEIHRDGAVALAIGGDVSLRHMVSQGCRPVGDAWVVTKAHGNVLVEIGAQPAADRIREAYATADEGDRELMRQGLHIGIAIDEYADRHELGDFVIRGVIGAEEETGSVAVGDHVEVGQTVRFQVRDARSADEDLRAELQRAAGPCTGALLFTCNGRGERLFGTADHDAQLVVQALGGAPLAGCFAAGELGPVGGRSFLHGFTASLLVVE